MAKAERERFGVETVATHLAATWEAGTLPHAATLAIVGRRIAVAILAIERNVSAMPRLRYDKVALRFVRDVETALGAAVPVGKTVVLTISAPIKLAAKATAALTERILALLADRTRAGDVKLMILGNQIRARILSHGAAGHPKAIGFVHTATPHAAALLDATQALLDRIAAAAKTRPATNVGGAPWLVLVAHDGAAAGAIYRHVTARLAAPVPFGKVLLVSDAGQVAALAE